MAGVLLLVMPGLSSPVISTAVGDPVPLAGYAPGADVVYLFVTGPNLPANGVRLDDISAPVTTGDPSSFTRASVQEYRWEYTWYTRTKGGPPDAGTYTIFIVTTPVGRRDLAGAEYTTIMVSLGSPGLVVLPEGGVTIRSSPGENDSDQDEVPLGTTSMEHPVTPQGNHTPGGTNGSATGPGTILNVTGTDKLPSLSGTVATLETRPEKIPFPFTAALAAGGISAGIGAIKAAKKREQP